ncbi:TadE/TadG family type IV pilus assembly protein [Dongia sp.]|uniref:TadE/TadG family type IV pilus assembly protein n=1 Tax=Dongia sp. TaxID=1977262 RepID=UPI0035AEBD5D
MRKFVTGLKRFLRDNSGSPAVEFALTAPILLMLTCGLIDFGLAVRAKSDIEAAARAGLQKGFGNIWDKDAISVAVKNAYSTDTAKQDNVTVDSFASCYCDGSMTGSGDSCTKTTTCGGGGYPDYYLTVNVTEQYSMLLDYFLFPDTLSLSANAMARAQP